MGRRRRAGAGTGLPSVSNFHQLPVVLLQLPMMGSAQGHQIVEVGGNAVTPIPQVMQLGAVNRGVAPHAPPVPDGGGQPLRTVAQPLVATQPQHSPLPPKITPHTKASGDRLSRTEDGTGPVPNTFTRPVRTETVDHSQVGCYRRLRNGPYRSHPHGQHGRGGESVLL